MAYIIKPISEGGGNNGITAEEAADLLANYQDKLYDTTTAPSGVTPNIKTVNNQSLLGSGNINIQV